MSVRVSNELFERVSKTRKHAKAHDAAIDINQACAERIAELLDEYELWYAEHKAEEKRKEGEAVEATANATTRENTTGATGPLHTSFGAGG